MIRELFAVGLGGAAGSIVRYMLSVWLLGGTRCWVFRPERSRSTPRDRC